MLWNDRSLTTQNNGLSHSFESDQSGIYVHLVDVKEKNNSVFSGRPFSKRTRNFHAHFDPFPPLVRPAMHAIPILLLLINILFLLSFLSYLFRSLFLSNV